jgi:hypothetical protein
MKKILGHFGILLTLSLVFLFSNIQIASGQEKKVKSSPLPENIKNICQTSCTPCHWNDGKKMALSMINFSKWEEYSFEKQTKKASLICKTLNKGKMPPKSARKSVPESIPTKEQIDLICGWAESLKSK